MRSELYNIFINFYCFKILLCLLGGIVRIPVILNNMVHMVMYSYYLLSAMGPGIQKKINNYKKYITIIQMVKTFYYLCKNEIAQIIKNIYN